MIEIRITYYPPVACQHLEGKSSIGKRLTLKQLREGSSVGSSVVAEAARSLYEILKANCPTLRDEVEV